MVRLASFPVSLFQYINITMQHSHFVFAVAISINNCHAVCYNSQVVRISYLYWKGIITGKVPSTIASLLCDHATSLYEFLMITPFSLSATLVILLCGTINPLLQYSSIVLYVWIYASQGDNWVPDVMVLVVTIQVHAGTSPLHVESFLDLPLHPEGLPLNNLDVFP